MEHVLTLFIFVMLLVILGMPIAYSLGVSGLLYFLFIGPDLKNVLIIRVFSGLDSYTLIALPLFILMGNIMSSGGLTRALINISLVIFGRIRGALAFVNVFASMIFGGISGSSLADTAALGNILIPEMVNSGYSVKDSAGITVASSTVGMIIPPSIPMIIYAIVARESIGKLFLAGAIPGVLIILLQLIITYIIGKKKDWPITKIDMSGRKIVKTIFKSLPGIFMPLFVVGVIVFGITTATEAAAAGVLYATICGFFIYQELTLKKLLIAIKESIYISASIMVFVSFALILGWIFTVEGVPVAIENILFALDVPSYVILLLFSVFLLFIGTFFDPGIAIILLTPIFLPAMKGLGVDPIILGVIMVLALAIGLDTPPVGGCLNIASKISGIGIEKIFVGSLPWLLANIITLILVIFFPQISLFLVGFID